MGNIGANRQNFKTGAAQVAPTNHFVINNCWFSKLTLPSFGYKSDTTRYNPQRAKRITRSKAWSPFKLRALTTKPPKTRNVQHG